MTSRRRRGAPKPAPDAPLAAPPTRGEVERRTPAWVAARGQVGVARAATLRALWAACGARAGQVTQVGLGSSWADVRGAACPEAWAVAVREQTTVVLVPDGLAEQDQAEYKGFDRAPTAGFAEIMDTPVSEEVNYGR